jgi:hypothetical protein
MDKRRLEMTHVKILCGRQSGVLHRYTCTRPKNQSGKIFTHLCAEAPGTIILAANRSTETLP